MIVWKSDSWYYRCKQSADMTVIAIVWLWPIGPTTMSLHVSSCL